MVKKTLIGTLVGCALAFSMGFVPVSALTVDDIQAQIRALTQQIAELTKRLNEIRGQPSEPTVIGSPMPAKHRVCWILVRNIAQGAKGDDVRSLQEFLQEEGLLVAEPTGYFGPLTAQAVAKWQAREGVSALGMFGPMSRERLKIWCGGGNQNFSASPVRGNAPLAVTFYSKVSAFRPQSDTYSIDFGDGTTEPAASCYAPTDWCQRPGINTHTYTSDGIYIAVLYHYSDPCMGNPQCRAPVSREAIGRVVIHVGAQACTKEYKPVCGSKPIVCITTPCNPIEQTYSNRCMMEADGASFLHVGECGNVIDPGSDPQCKSWTDGNVCGSRCHREYVGGPPICYALMCAPLPGTVPPDGVPQCLEHFNNSGKPPVISGFSGPTTLAVNETGTWRINAWDPENGQLSYHITWGDEVYALPMNASAATESSVVQTTTFTHSYSSAGTYTVTIIVTDTTGKSAKSSSTVRVIGNIACTMEYAPVCGRPAGCVPCNAQPGLSCPAICQLYQPKTYGNRCVMNADGATFLHSGECTAESGNIY